jgi:hypothetical protein
MGISAKFAPSDQDASAYDNSISIITYGYVPSQKGRVSTVQIEGYIPSWPDDISGSIEPAVLSRFFYPRGKESRWWGSTLDRISRHSELEQLKRQIYSESGPNPKMMTFTGKIASDLSIAYFPRAEDRACLRHKIIDGLLFYEPSGRIAHSQCFIPVNTGHRYSNATGKTTVGGMGFIGLYQCIILSFGAQQFWESGPRQDGARAALGTALDVNADTYPEIEDKTLFDKFLPMDADLVKQRMK